MIGKQEVRPSGRRASPQATGWQVGAGRLAAGIAAVLAAAVIVLGAFVAPAPAQPTKTETAPDTPSVVPPSTQKHRVIAYYFCYNFRCARCRAFETYSREALESAFAKQLKNGSLVWKVVNVEVKGNEHFVKDYKLYTKSLVLVNEARGKPTQWKNLEKIWQLVGDKAAFIRYVQDETRAYLEKRS